MNTMLQSGKAEYFSGLASPLRAKLAKFWKQFQSFVDLGVIVKLQLQLMISMNTL